MRYTKIGIAIIICAVLLIVAEMYARYGLGLGDPPLSIPDEQVDYLFAPNQNCKRFGNCIIYNNASMRCDFDVLERGQTDKRIFIVGDSVINGGVLTDHKDLATTILQEQLDPTRERVQVCNVSAGSWGPGNYSAYFRKYRQLISTNDVLIVEVNSHDLWEDDPSVATGKNVGIDIAIPKRKPCCALWDGFYRYFIPRIRAKLALSKITTKVDLPVWQNDPTSGQAQYNLRMLDELYAYPFSQRMLLLYRSKQETENNLETPGETAFRAYANKNGIRIIEVGMGSEDYRDKIHPSKSGQKKIADAIWSVIQ